MANQRLFDSVGDTGKAAMKRYHLQRAGDGQPFTLVSGCPGPSGLCMGVSPAVVSDGCALAVVLGLLAAAAPRGEHGLWGLWTQEPGLDGCVQASAASQHVPSSQVGDQTHVSCIGRWILTH